MLSSRHVNPRTGPTSSDFPALPYSYASFRSLLLRISSFSLNRTREEKSNIEKLYSELDQVDLKMWEQLMETQTWETGLRRNAAEVVQENLENLVTKLNDKQANLSSRSIVHIRERIMGILVEGGVHWPQLVKRQLPRPEELDASFETFNLNARLLNNVNYGDTHPTVWQARHEISNALAKVTKKEWEKLEKTNSKWHRSLSCAAEITDIVLGILEESMNGLKAQQLARAKKQLVDILKFANIKAPWLDQLARIYIHLPALPRPAQVFVQRFQFHANEFRTRNLLLPFIPAGLK